MNFYTLFILPEITICSNNTSHWESLQPHRKKYLVWCCTTWGDYWWKTWCL